MLKPTYLLVLPYWLLLFYPLVITKTKQQKDMSKDKKEIFGAMLAEYQKLQKLEKQYPTLAQTFEKAADAKLFGQIRTTLDKKIADLLAAQAAKIATTTAAPDPSPDDEPNINKATFQSVLKNWATKQRTELQKLSTSSVVIKKAHLKNMLEAGTSSFLVVEELRAQMSEALTKDEMSIADISAALTNAINNYLPNNDKGFEELFKKDKKDYKAAPDFVFTTALGLLDPQTWLKEEVEKVEKEAKKAEKEAKKAEKAEKAKRELEATIDSILSCNNKLVALLEKEKGRGYKVHIPTILNQWGQNIKNWGLEQIYSPLLECIAVPEEHLDITDFYNLVNQCCTNYTKENLLKRSDVPYFRSGESMAEYLAMTAINSNTSKDEILATNYKNQINKWLTEVKGAAAAADANPFAIDKLKTNVSKLFMEIDYEGIKPVAFISEIFQQQLDCVSEKKPSIDQRALDTAWNETLSRLDVNTFAAQYKESKDPEQKKKLMENCYSYLPAKDSIKLCFENSGKSKQTVLVLNNQSNPQQSGGNELNFILTLAQPQNNTGIPPMFIEVQITLSNMKFNWVSSSIQHQGKPLLYPELTSASSAIGSKKISGVTLSDSSKLTIDKGLQLAKSVTDFTRQTATLSIEITTPQFTLTKYTEGSTNQVKATIGGGATAFGTVFLATASTNPIGWGVLAISGTSLAIGGFLTGDAKTDPTQKELIIPSNTRTISIMVTFSSKYDDQGKPYIEIVPGDIQPLVEADLKDLNITTKISRAALYIDPSKK